MPPASPVDPDEVPIVWVDGLAATLPGYSRADPPEIVANRQYWVGRSRREWEAFLAHEQAHIETAAFYLLNADVPVSTVLRVEGRADRAALRRRIPDAEISAALTEGYTELYEFAAAWQCDERTAEARLWLWRHGA